MYIYYGHPNFPNSRESSPQIIRAPEINDNNFKGFGSTLFGNIDLDKNGTPGLLHEIIMIWRMEEPYNEWKNDANRSFNRCCVHKPNCHLPHSATPKASAGGHKLPNASRLSSDLQVEKRRFVIPTSFLHIVTDSTKKRWKIRYAKLSDMFTLQPYLLHKKCWQRFK